MPQTFPDTLPDGALVSAENRPTVLQGSPLCRRGNDCIVISANIGNIRAQPCRGHGEHECRG